MPYRLVIFDSDGTLADTLPWMRSIFNDLAGEYRFRKVAADEFDEFRDLHGRELLKRLGLPLWKLPLVIAAMRRRMAAHEGPLQFFPGMDSALKTLAGAGVKLAVVSSNSRANVARVIGPELLPLFYHLDCGASIFGKAAKLRSMVRRAVVSATETIYLGDEIRDAEAARDAGVAFGAVAWGQHRMETLLTEKPALAFQTVEEMVPKLLPRK
jgi:phosphoglycolate phosphatase